MRRVVAAVVASAILSTGPAPGAIAAPSGATTRISIGTDGAQGSSASRLADVSGDGRFVAFESAAFTLVPGDTNGVSDVFVRDRLSGTTTRVSVPTGGGQGNAASDSASISRDGRWVAFASAATNLVPDDTNGVRDVFVHDLVAGTTTRVSVTASGAQAGGISFAPRLSADGRYVVFFTYSDLAGTGADTGMVNSYRVDRTSGQVDDLCVRWDGLFVRLCLSPAISDDGRYVAFEAQGKLAADDTNNVTDIYLRDMTDRVTMRVSISSGGAQSNSLSLAPSISGSGRVVAFTSWASNLVADDLNGATDVYLRDLAMSTTERVTVGLGSAQPNGSSWTRPTGGTSSGRAVSGDGRYVVFHSFASNLVSPDTNGTADVFVRDRAASRTSIASLTWDDLQNGFASNGSISADGRFVTFESSSSGLVLGDTNGVGDVFIRDLTPNTPPTLSLPSDMQVFLEDGLSVSASFTDPDLGQSWTGTVAYGDGSAPVALAIQADKTFTLAQAFTALGAYAVQVTVTDSAGASATGTFGVTVTPKPVTFTDRRSGMSISVQLHPDASDLGHVTFTAPGTGIYSLDAAADMKGPSATTLLINYSGPAHLSTGAGTVALSVELTARLDPARLMGQTTLTDSEGRRFHLVAR